MPVMTINEINIVGLLKREKYADRERKDEPIKGENYFNNNLNGMHNSDEDGKGNKCNNPDHSNLENKIKKLNEQINDLQLIGGLGKPEEIQPKIRELLNKTKQEWEDCLELDEKEREDKYFVLSLLWKDSKKEERAKEILTLISNTEQDTLEAYKELYKKWNEEKEEFDYNNDFGGALFTLWNYLKAWENPPKPALTTEQQQKLDNFDDLHEKLLTNLRQELNSHLLTFRANINVSPRDLRKQYSEHNKNYQSIIQNLSLEELLSEIPGNAIKAVIVICATEKAEEYDKKLESEGDKVTTSNIFSLLDYLGSIKSNWEQIQTTDIPSENNKLYLPIIDKKEEKRQKIEELIDKWKKKV